MNQRQITEDVTVGGQPTEEDIQRLHQEGFRTVINLRSDDEQGALHDEKEFVERAGMNYASIPISPATVDDLAADRLIQALDSIDARPALLHCGSGGRAGVMSLIYLAISKGWTLQQALDEGARKGILPSPTSPYRQFVEDFIKRHSAGERGMEG